MQKVLTPDEDAEYRRLYDQFIEAVMLAGKILETHGMESAEFLKADSTSGAIANWRSRPMA